MSIARASAAAFFLGLGTLLWPATVCVNFFETGVAEDDPAIESSSAWESGMLDALFDSGQIVSNSLMTRLQSGGLPSSSVGLVEAREGGAEYIIHVALEYGTASASRRSPRKAFYRLCDARGDTILKGETAELAATASGAEDEQNARKAARLMIGSIGKGR